MRTGGFRRGEGPSGRASGPSRVPSPRSGVRGRRVSPTRADRGATMRSVALDAAGGWNKVQAQARPRKPCPTGRGSARPLACGPRRPPLKPSPQPREPLGGPATRPPGTPTPGDGSTRPCTEDGLPPRRIDAPTSALRGRPLGHEPRGPPARARASRSSREDLVERRPSVIAAARPDLRTMPLSEGASPAGGDIPTALGGRPPSPLPPRDHTRPGSGCTAARPPPTRPEARLRRRRTR